jgi:glycerophosphoryl diester phosphodiesterase
VTDATARTQEVPASAGTSWPLRLIAHRGWSARFPENSLAAFAAAVAGGADELELDVRLTSDGVPVVIHDADVDRVCERAGPVADLSWADLMDVGVRAPSGPPVPAMGLARLDEVLRLFAPHVGLNVHVKVADPRAVAPVAAAAARHRDRLIYVAGAEDVLELALERHPDTPRFCLARQRDPEVLLGHALRYTCAGLQYVSGRYDANATSEARRHGLRCNLFYADTVEDANAAIAAGIDGVLTNDVGIVRAGVERRATTG